MSLLDALYRGGQLRTLDHALARTLQRLDPDTPDAVLGLATGRSDAALGWSLVLGGGLAAAVGVVLIAVRARLKTD